MATAVEICTRALRRTGSFDVLDNPSAVDVATATEALNAMIASWEAEGLSGDVLPLDSRFEQAVVAMLGVRLCEEYGKSPGPVLVRDADNGWMALQAAYFAVPPSRFDCALTGTGAGFGSIFLLGEDADLFHSAWAANTDYTLRKFVSNGANLYELVTAGTSAASGGPTGTGSEIADGTCVWCWRRVLAS
jgi:hypothetical protein